MIETCKKPILSVEGAGDVKAVPRLIREVLHFNGLFDINPAPRPKSNVEVRKLMRTGELERYVGYGIRDDGDSVLLVLDCDDFCPIKVCKDFIARIIAMSPQKKVGISLFKSEFESLFVHCIDEIVARFSEYGWSSNRTPLGGDIESIRDAKGTLSRMMRSERAYKETRDQEKFITALDFLKLRQRSRSFRHFENTLLWLANGDGRTYPRITTSR
jgi:Domain of unknown function (DUF4276)